MRVFPQALLNLLDEGRVKYAGMLRVDLGEGAFGLIQSSAPYTWQGLTYKPIPAGLVQVSSLQMTTGTTAIGFTVEIAQNAETGLTAEQIADFESYDYRDRSIRFMDLHVHPDTGAILGDPITQKRGYINAVKHIEDPSRGFVLVLECEDRGMDFGRRNARMRSHEDQQKRLATDKFFEHAATAGKIQQKVNL